MMLARDMQLALCRWGFGAVHGRGRRWRDNVLSVLSCPIIFVYIRPTFVHEVIAICRRAMTHTHAPLLQEVIAIYLDKRNIIRNGSVSGPDVVLHASETDRGLAGTHTLSFASTDTT